METLTKIFYLLGIIFFIYEFSVLINPIKNFKFSEELEKWTKKDKKNIVLDDLKYVLYLFFMLFYMIWSIIGFGTSQWFLFVGLFGLSGLDYLLKKISDNYNYKIFILLLDSLLSVLLLGYIISNHFHHFDLINLIP